MDILMVKRGGRFSGEAFALLPASSQMDFALAKNKTYMGKRYVEVFRAKKLVSIFEVAGRPAPDTPSLYYCRAVARVALPVWAGSGAEWRCGWHMVVNGRDGCRITTRR